MSPLDLPSPGWRSIRGCHTDAYRRFYCALWELEIGETTTIAEVARSVKPTIELNTSWLAMRIAARCRLVKGTQERPHTIATWVRQRMPKLITAESLMINGVRAARAFNFLEALRTGGYLRLTGKGYEAAD